jgi:hypothetical protein
MQLPDNNMDDLFRKAAADYPLKINDGDWESVAGKLADEEGFASTEKGAGKKGSRKILWLLALLPLAAIGYNYFHKNGTEEKNIAQQKINMAQQNDLSRPKNSLANTNTVNVAASSNALQQSVSKSKEVDNAKAVNDELLIVNRSKPSSNISPLQNNLSNNKNAESGNINQQNKVIVLQNNLKNNAANGKNNGAENGVNTNSNTSSPLNKNDRVLQSGNTINDAAINSSVADNNKNVLLKKNNEDVNKNIAVSKNTDSSSAKNNPKKNFSTNAKQHFLYAGILAGPDVSMVKFQSIKGAGYSLGLLFGYHFSQRWSLETGILWDQKKYYTNGEYFNTSKIVLLPGEQLKTMNGTCGMFEIPLSIKYDFVKRKNGNFFAAAGLSSYIMKNEAYNYTALYNGWSYNGSQSYKNSSRNWFSVVQISAGYEKKLGKNFNLRIEPYLKIPLKGVGIGGLPITSGGLYIGITKSIH